MRNISWIVGSSVKHRISRKSDWDPCVVISARLSSEERGLTNYPVAKSSMAGSFVKTELSNASVRFK